MRDEEALDGAVEYDDFDPLVAFDRGDNRIQLWNALRAEDIEWRMVERHAPVGWQPSFETNALRILCTGHGSILQYCTVPAGPADLLEPVHGEIGLNDLDRNLLR